MPRSKPPAEPAEPEAHEPSLADLFPTPPTHAQPKSWMAPEELARLHLAGGGRVADHPAEPSKAFVDGVRAVGVLFPVILSQRGARLEVRDGIRRIKAAVAAQLTWVPVRIFGDLRGASGAAATLVANYHRGANPVQELRAIEQLLEVAGSEQRLAAMVGIPLGVVRRRLKLRGLVRDLRAAFDRGQLSAAVAERAATLPVPAQNRLAERLQHAAEEGAPVRLSAKDVRAEREVTTRAVAEELPEAMFPDQRTEPEGGYDWALNADDQEELRRWLDGAQPLARRGALTKLIAAAFHNGRTVPRWADGMEYATVVLLQLVKPEPAA